MQPRLPLLRRLSLPLRAVQPDLPTLPAASVHRLLCRSLRH
jgi:hypothetical protein